MFDPSKALFPGTTSIANYRLGGRVDGEPTSVGAPVAFNHSSAFFSVPAPTIRTTVTSRAAVALELVAN